MSVRAMAWAVGQDVGNPLRKLVLMILADEHRNDTDLCFPGLERIAAIGEISTKSAARHIDALAELGLITVYRRGRSHGYTLHCPAKEDSESGDRSQRTSATADSVSMTPDSLSATPDSVSKTPDRESTEPGGTDSNRERTGGGRARAPTTPLASMLIGDHLKPIPNLPARRAWTMDTFSEPQTASETTGTLSRDSGASNATGPRPGATGYGRTSNDCKDPEPLEPGTARWDSLMEAIGARAAERKAEVGLAIAEKRWFRASLTQLLNGRGKPPEILMERASEDTGRWLPPSVSEAQGAAIVEELALARQAVVPAGPEATGLILAKLALVLILPDGNDHKLMMATYIEDLEDVPADVLDNACRKWRRREKFWPTIAE